MSPKEPFAHEPHCPVPRAAERGEGAVCLCVHVPKNEYIDLTLEQVREAQRAMLAGAYIPDAIRLVLPTVLMWAEVELMGKPQAEAAAARLEAFKAKIALKREAQQYEVQI